MGKTAAAADPFPEIFFSGAGIGGRRPWSDKGGRTRGDRQVNDPAMTRRFAEVALPHLDAAHNLARWLTGNDQDAQDVVQEAYLRALRFFDGYHGGNPRAWLLAIVRRTCFSWLRANRPAELVAGGDEAMPEAVDPHTPEDAALGAADRRDLETIMAAMPAEFREVLILREVEELSYKEIAVIVEAPVGTVMSRLSRARQSLRRGWAATLETGHGA